MVAALAVALIAVAAIAGWRLVLAKSEAERLRGSESALSERARSLESSLADAREESARYRAEAAAAEKAVAEIKSQAEGIAVKVMQQSGAGIVKEVADRLDTQAKLRSVEMDKQKDAIQGIVKPVTDNLRNVENQINEMERKREGAYKELNGQVDRMVQQTHDLNLILHSNQGRGNWAEQQLANILELAGMTEHVDFFIQESLSGNTARPDVIVQVPNGAKVAIDAKFPLVSDTSRQEDRPRDEVQREYASKLNKHSKELGQKNYSERVDGPLDFTVMFVPNTPILDEAMAANPAIWEDAWRQHRVLIATPGMLIAFLRTVALSWHQHEFAQNVEKIAEEAKELYERLSKYAGHVDKVGEKLQQAMKAHNESVGSLERRVFPAARQFKDYGLDTPKSLPEASILDVPFRRLDVAEAIKALPSDLQPD